MSESKPPATYPFSVRFTLEERASLENEATGVPLGTFIRAKVLGEPLPAKLRRTGYALKDRNALAKVLALLGQSRLASNINQLAHLAHVGALPITPETEVEIREAMTAVRAMRCDLVTALGLKSVDAP